MWCELVMNGIGGRTIAEAQANMSFAEFCLWGKFRRLRGSLHLGMRVETNLAQLQAMYANYHRPNTAAPVLHPEDFAPHMDERIIPLHELTAHWS